MSAPCRSLSSVLSATMAPEDRKAILAYYEAMLWERDTGGVEGRRIAVAMQRGQIVDVPDVYWTNVCCRCEGRGFVVPRSRTGTLLPVDWKCEGCGRFVCHHCTLTVPGSVPVRFREETLCSRECWEKIGSPVEEEEEDSWTK